jgi:hypothetical protein
MNAKQRSQSKYLFITMATIIFIISFFKQSFSLELNKQIGVSPVTQTGINTAEIGENISSALEYEKELDCELVSIALKGQPYSEGDAPVALVAGEVFAFSVTLKNTGTAVWGQFIREGERGATLLSRNPDYNEDFGVFLISPGQGSRVQPGATFTYSTRLRAPSAPGEYTMTWQLADWIIMYNGMGITYQNQPFYGQPLSVRCAVGPRAGPPPPQKGRVPGVLDIHDFEYRGSFSLPTVPGIPAPHWDEKAFNASGIALRSVGGEKRMLLTTGTYTQYVYEVAIPEPGMFIGNDAGAVPVAEFRALFGMMPKGAGVDVFGNICNSNINGTMWYDEGDDLLYWTNAHDYLTSWVLPFPVLRSASLAGGVLTESRQWFLPDYAPGHYKSYWGGVTKIPDGFAQKYTGGRKLALGFGGGYTIISICSSGPSLAAVTPDNPTGLLDFQNIMYYPNPEYCVRDGNYIPMISYDPLPADPWRGGWTSCDTIGSGVFVDLPDKQGYVVFARQATGRIGYDYGGYNWNGKYQNAWYFYDYDTLGRAPAGETSARGIYPSSISIVDLPNENTKDSQVIAGSYFDAETRRLYVYTLWALKRGGIYIDPVVHVYEVTEDVPGGDSGDGDGDGGDGGGDGEDGGAGDGEDSGAADGGDGNGKEENGNGNIDNPDKGNDPQTDAQGKRPSGGSPATSVNEPNHPVPKNDNNSDTNTSAVSAEVSPLEKSIPDHASPLGESAFDAANPFADVFETDWHYEDIMKVYGRRLMIGVSEEPMLFDPNAAVTRGMIMTVLYRLANSPGTANLSNPFSDVTEGQWYADAIRWGASRNIVYGYSDETYKPDTSVSREDLAAIIYRYADYDNILLPESRNYDGFNDETDISEYAKNAIERLYVAGIVNGYPDGGVQPLKDASRAEFASIINRLIRFIR